jgi:N-acetylmuramic acid 6-phosphate etherase
LTEDFGKLITEGRRPDLSDLDRLPTTGLVRLMNAEDALVPEAVGRASEAISTAIDAIAERLAAGGRLVYVGAGTAGRIGALDAAECPPTFNAPPEQVVSLMAGGESAFSAAVEGAEDRTEEGAADIERLGVGERDAVVGVSASGRTPYVLGAVERARRAGALTIGVSCNPDSRLGALVEHPIEVVVGPEFIAGSTRLKAGTAQKLVLNMISTITMVRLGKTYGNLMVDLRATNSKLRDRARRIVALATGADGAELDEALSAADGEVKPAIVMLLAGVSADEARRRLTEHGGRVRGALEV